MARARDKTFSDQLADSIRHSGLSLYAIERQCGVSNAALSRFLSGQRGLTTASVDKLAACLGLELRPKAKRKGAKS